MKKQIFFLGFFTFLTFTFSAMASSDFNGNGYDDVLIPVHSEDVSSIANAGSVNLVYGSSSGLTTSGNWLVNQDVSGIEDTAEEGDEFGITVVYGNFNNDSYDDAVVGILNETTNSESGGAFQVLYGTSSGLTASNDAFWNQDTTGVLDTVEFDDMFGATFAVGDFDNDSYHDLVVGIPLEEYGSDWGAFQVFYGSSSGLSTTDSIFYYDSYGNSLAVGYFNDDRYADLAVGVPLETVSSNPLAGTVHVFYGSSSGITSTHDTFSQDTSGIEGAAETGDQFGSTLIAGDFDGNGTDDVAIGVPFEDVSYGGNNVSDAGCVNIIYSADDGSGLSAVGDQLIYQSNDGFGGVPEANDYFSISLAAASFDGNSYSDLAIGVPQEDYSSTDDGVIQVIYGSSSGLDTGTDEIWSEDSAYMNDTAQNGDRFGDYLQSGDYNGDNYDDVVVAIPFKDLDGVSNAGDVHVIYGSSGGLSATYVSDLVLSQDALEGSPEENDTFGGISLYDGAL